MVDTSQSKYAYQLKVAVGNAELKCAHLIYLYNHITQLLLYCFNSNMM